MFPVLQIGHVAIQTPGLILIIGLWFSLDWAENYFMKHGIQPSMGYTLVAIGLVAAVIGGRLAYAAENYTAFAASPTSLISLNLNLWDMPGGVVLGLAGAILYGIHHKINFWNLLDSLTPSFAVILIAAGLSNLASGSAFGEPARLPWSIFLWGEWRHPSQIYETLAAIGVLCWVLWRQPRADKKQVQPAVYRSIFLEFLAWSAAWEIALGMFRGDGTLIPGQIRAGQATAWVVLASVLYLMGKRNLRLTNSPSGRENEETIQHRQ